MYQDNAGQPQRNAALEFASRLPGLLTRYDAQGSAVTSRRYPSWLPVVGVVLLALAASISGIGNQFAQDDFAIILKNAPVHDLLHGWQLFTKPYWPPPFVPDLYRPLALLSYAVQWVVGGGSPLVFRLFSYGLYAVVCTQVLRLARLQLSFPPAFVAASLFAVHPVHVEAVAMAVNQGELWVALFSCLAAAAYLKARRSGGVLQGRTELAIGGFYLVACFFKENALMLPGIPGGGGAAAGPLPGLLVAADPDRSDGSFSCSPWWGFPSTGSEPSFSTEIWSARLPRKPWPISRWVNGRSPC